MESGKGWIKKNFVSKLKTYRYFGSHHEIIV